MTLANATHYFLLYVAHENRIEQACRTIERLGAKPASKSEVGESYLLQHNLLGNQQFHVHFLSKLDAVAPHMRNRPVDLMIFDERDQKQKSLAAIEQLSKDVAELARLWGPDFHFPISRVVCILEDDINTAERVFALGREKVRDVLVDPKEVFKILRWVSHVLAREVKKSPPRVGCALSGGGLEGYLYQLGCVYALNTALSHGRRSIFDIDVYSGISSGSILAAGLANKVSLEEMILSLKGKSSVLPALKSSVLYDFAFKEVSQRIIAQTMRWSGFDPVRWGQKLAKSVPTGIFKGDNLRNYIKEAIYAYGGNDYFHGLEKELYIGATDQDTFEHVVLGLEPWQHVRISDSVRASCSLPPIYTPALIDHTRFVDGQITRTANLELLVRRGCNLIFIIDPMLPFAFGTAGSVDQEGGIFTLIQALKTLIQTRFRTALEHATVHYPDVDFMVFQPYDECARAMAGMPMKYRIDANLCDLAYRSTIRKLQARHQVYSVKFEKYGFHLASIRELKQLELKGIGLPS